MKSISTSQIRLNNLDKILCKSRSDFETQYYPSQDASSSHSLRIIKASKNSDSQPKLRFSGDTESLVSSSQYGNPNRFDEVLHVQRHREILESVRQLSKSITNLDTMLQKVRKDFFVLFMLVILRLYLRCIKCKFNPHP